MRSSLLALGLVLLLAAAGLPAQAAGAHRGLFVGLANVGSSPSSGVAQLDPANRLTVYTSRTGGPWPYWGNVWGATLDTDNETVLVHALVGLTNPPARYALVRWDPAQRSVVGTLWSGPFNLGRPRNLTNLTLDADGNVVSYDSVLSQLVRFDRLAGTWSGVRLQTPGLNAGLGGFVWDRLRGDFVYANARNSGGAVQVLLRTNPSWTQTTTLATTQSASLQAAWGGDLLQNGDWMSSASAGFAYLEVPAGSRSWRAGPASGRLYWDVTAEKFAAPGRGFYAGLVFSPQQLAYVDPRTTPHTVTNLYSSPALPSWILEVLPLHQRDLCTRRTGKATWDLLVNPGGGAHAGKAFVVAASLAGAVPATPLPDGREIFLQPDALTLLSARGAVWPLLTGNAGRLDAAGKATARLDLAPLGVALNGTVVHFAGVVLDPAAPHGLAWVLDPWAFVIDVHP